VLGPALIYVAVFGVYIYWIHLCGACCIWRKTVSQLCPPCMAWWRAVCSFSWQ